MKKLKMGMVGGGIGAFIGEVHRKAARMDGGADIVAGAFDVDPEKSLEQGRNLGLDPKRVYRTYKDMIAGELALPRRNASTSSRSARPTTRTSRSRRRASRPGST